MLTFTVNIVNVIQLSVLTLTLFGIFLLFPYKKYQYICYLMGFVAFSSLFNLLEELNITREFYLITPVFLLGFGPAIFLAIKSLIGPSPKKIDILHFIPMFLAIPFTHEPEIIIAIGTVSRIIYSLFSLKMLIHFYKNVVKERSDALELSVTWLITLLSIMTVINAANMIRLNIQPFISHQINVIGQGVSTFVALLFFAIFIRQLIQQKDAFLSLKSLHLSSVDLKENEEKADDGYFLKIYENLVEQIQENHWYRIPRLTLHQLSELSGLQVRDISRSINIVSQQNYNDFINQFRLTEVKKRLIEQPNEAILTIALDTGFNAKSSFNTAFKRFTLLTPAEYRKLNTKPLNQ